MRLTRVQIHADRGTYKNVLGLNGFEAHDSCPELIAVQGNVVATASQREVRVWQWRPTGELDLRLAAYVLS